MFGILQLSYILIGENLTNRRNKTKQTNHPYKSRLEKKISVFLTDPLSVYEKEKLKYDVTHTYTPDFQIGPNKFIEGKGRFTSADRAKHLYIKEQHPDIQIFFVFGNPDNKLSRVSKTTYGEWASKHGYLWCHVSDFNKSILKKWINWENK